ncbi:MAG: phosphatidylglycerophosphatase A [Candidatus Dadabacteria bacterium]|nr:MAG: phosphatidylglycerophosphatase A [Candidatus Dadabacteria bacterium]
MRKGIAKLIATVFYVGLIPIAPGTFGTIAAIPLFYALSFTPLYLYLAITVLIILISVWASGVAEEIFGKTDPSEVVADEVCGYLVTMILVPVTLGNIFFGFLLFRLFDIAKPYPIRKFERLPGGWGIVMDDVMAGVYSCITLHILGRWFFWA